MTELTEATRALLRQAGWYEGRSIPTTKYEASLGKGGFPVHPVVVQFLQEFGGLEIVYPAEGVPGSTYRLSFKANWVLGGLIAANGRADPEVMDGYAARVGAPLCYIGSILSGLEALLMDPSGNVYAADDDSLIWLGESGCDAIDATCTGRPNGRRIP